MFLRLLSSVGKEDRMIGVRVLCTCTALDSPNTLHEMRDQQLLGSGPTNSCRIRKELMCIGAIQSDPPSRSASPDGLVTPD